MRLSSIRARVLVLGIIAASIVVSASLALTYLVVVNGVNDVATRETARLAARATEEVSRASSMATTSARQKGLTRQAATAEMQRAFLKEAGDRFSAANRFSEAHFALWDKADVLQYSSDSRALVKDAAGRTRAIRQGRSVPAHFGGHHIALDLVLPPDMGAYVVHVPIVEPDGKSRVLDVVYEAEDEKKAMILIRPLMLAMSITAVAITVLIMLSSTNWVLRLVDELRIAADSVDAGRLNVTLPEHGDNEVGDLARSLNALIGRLKQRAEMQTRFVADASHELATPVAGIRGYLGILRGWGKDDLEVREEALEAIDRESRRMVRLTGQMLALIRSESELEVPQAHFDVNALSRRVLADTATRYSDKRLEFVGPDDAELIVVGDADRVEDVLAILVDNAAKYTPARGKVWVGTSRRKGDVLIEVGDTGEGIPTADLDSIFERFYRSDASRAKATGGFGLGLAIARGIVEAIGGTISVKSVVGEGTRFTVRLSRNGRARGDETAA